MSLKKIKNFGHEWEAELAKGRLENMGIKSNVQRGFNAITGMYGENDLFVQEEDIEEALKVLK
jgi:hypothetical protein